MGQLQNLTAYSKAEGGGERSLERPNGGADGGAHASRDPAAALETERRRRDELAALRAQALRQVPLERLAIDAATLAREELGVESCRIWCPLRGEGSFELIASSGGPAPAPPAEVPANGPRPTDDGLVFGLTAHGGHAVALSVHSDPRQEVSRDDLVLVEGLAQVLVGSVWGRSSEQLLVLAERRYRELIERLPVVTYLAEYGPAGKWLYVSPQIERLLGFPPEEWLVDRHFWWSRVHPEDRERVELEETNCAQTLEPLSIEYRMLARDGRVVWIRDEGALGRPANGDNAAVLLEGVLIDITERREAEEELRHRADHDELTGLVNRRRFTEELGRRRNATARAGRVAIVDVDDLKYFNDSLGHAAGDSLLRAVAASLLDRAARPTSSSPASAATSSRSCSRRRPRRGCARGSRRSCAPCASTSRASRRGRAPGPCASTPGPASTDEELIVAADIALHEAKERGGDRYEIFNGSGTERLAWVGHVREAIDAERLRLHAAADLRAAPRAPRSAARSWCGCSSRMARCSRPRPSCRPPSASA